MILTRPKFNAISLPNREEMKILFPDKHEEEIEANGQTIEKIIQNSGLNPLEYLISCKGEIIPEDTIADNSQTIELIRISHGG